MSRSLPHPSIASISVAGILHALSDPARLAIVRELLASDHGMSCTETTGKLGLTMPKSTCSHHYRILREAGVIASERNGTELTSRVRTEELETRFPGLLQSILRSYEREDLTARRAGEARSRGSLRSSVATQLRRRRA